ncbi:Hypothetical predicted protein [Marmota monax]|uniref:Uncharacterized protein n=1 Tax=Marmota monax TaxID=9995 RepID=A0A5E4D5L7_MARMO|nr:Hypothetical predicted protein [Marmota monax]
MIFKLDYSVNNCLWHQNRGVDVCRSPASLVLVPVWVPAPFSSAGGSAGGQRKDSTCWNFAGLLEPSEAIKVGERSRPDQYQK